MTYGDLPLDAPEKPNKGMEGGACNRRACQAEPALYWNHGSHSWYCADCARDIGEDPVNKRDWELRHRPTCGHAMFETREEITARQLAEDEATLARGELPEYEGFDLDRRYHIIPKGRLYFEPPIRNRDKPEPTYRSAPESRQVRRARERAEFKRLPRRA